MFCYYKVIKVVAGVSGETGDLVTRTARRKEKDFVPQKTSTSVREQTGIVFNSKRGNARTMNAMVSEKDELILWFWGCSHLVVLTTTILASQYYATKSYRVYRRLKIGQNLAKDKEGVQWPFERLTNTPIKMSFE